MFLRILVIAFFYSCLCSTFAFAQIKVITDRTPSHLEPIFQMYQQKTGQKVTPLFVKKGLLQRIKTRPKEADLILTKNAALLQKLKESRLLTSLNKTSTQALVRPEFIDPDLQFIATSYRIRGIFVPKGTNLGNIAMEDLGRAGRGHKVCIRTGFHEYNIELWAQMFDLLGPEKFKNFLVGLKKNLARRPKGKDRDQIKGVATTKCNRAIANSYYYGIMMDNAETKALAEKVSFIPTGQHKKGALVLASGAALTLNKERRKSAEGFVNFLLSEGAQSYFTQGMHALSVLKKPTKLSNHNQALGIENVKINMIPFSIRVKNRESVLAALKTIGFDD